MWVKQGCPLSPLAFGPFFNRAVNHMAQAIPSSQKGNALYIANLIVQIALYANELAIFRPNATTLYHILAQWISFAKKMGSG